jgi:dTDP-4-dehydrorhamnose 3,5-epimerase
VNAPSIDGVVLRDLDVFPDERGEFFEAFRQQAFADVPQVVQANISRSKAGVLRGMHFHRRQTDVWIPVVGRFHVGLYDLRAGSSTERTAFTHVLDAETPQALVIPPGVAHGFQALTAATLLYLVTEIYDGSDEHGFRFDDPDLGLSWPLPNPMVSDRDRTALPLREVLGG